MRILAFSALFLAFAPAAAQPVAMYDGGITVNASPAPAWTLDAALGEVRPEWMINTIDGQYTVLYDTQIKVNDANYELYRRHATKILDDPRGLNASNIALTFDPSKESLSLNKVVLWREGVPIDVTDRVEFSINRQEKLRAEGILNGYLTLHGTIPGAQIGDIVDWSATWDVSSPNWPGHFYHDFHTEWAVPSAFDRTRILVSEANPLTIRTRGTVPTPHQEASDGWRIFTWTREDVAPVTFYADAPSDRVQYAGVSVSNLEDWSQVASWGADLYAPSLIFSPAIAAKIESLRDRPVSQRATWAIRYVQDDIAYFSDSTGLGAHTPRSPATTIMRGYGDCKDKSLLLVSLLNALNVSADVALTDIDEGHSLSRLAPSPFAFDHAVVRIHHDGQYTYIDPTETQMGGVFPNMESANYGYALPLVPGGTLESMELGNNREAQIKVIETYDFSMADTDGITLSVKTIRRGLEADLFRRQLAGIKNPGLANEFLGYYQQIYPGIVGTGIIGVHDDRENNELVIEENYLMPAAVLTEDLLRTFPFEAEGARYVFSGLEQRSRPVPISIPYPFDGEHTIDVIGLNADNVDSQSVQVAAGPFTLFRSVETDSQIIRFRYQMQTRTGQIEPEEIAGVSAQYLDFLHSLTFSADISEALPTETAGRPGLGMISRQGR